MDKVCFRMHCDRPAKKMGLCQPCYTRRLKARKKAGVDVLRDLVAELDELRLDLGPQESFENGVTKELRMAAHRLAELSNKPGKGRKVGEPRKAHGTNHPSNLKKKPKPLQPFGGAPN